MPVRDIVDMHEIEPGVDETRNTAGRRLDDDPPGWRRLLVAWSDRRRRMHDNGWQISRAIIVSTTCSAATLLCL